MPKKDNNPSKHIRGLIQSLKWSCVKDCGELFALEEYYEKKRHEKIFTHCFNREKSLTSPMTLEDIFSVNSDISKDMEEAAVHIIKHKLAKSTLPNKQIEFKTGS